MSDEEKSPLSKKAEILADLWTGYKEDENFSEFVQYNDLGLPLAYALSYNIIEPNDRVETFVQETWDLLLSGLNLEDGDYESLDDLLAQSGQITE